MNIEREIAALIRDIAQEKEGDIIYQATVTKVAANSCEVELISDGRIFENVSLHLSEEAKDGLVITPEVNSQVLIATINGHDWFVCQYSEINQVTLYAIEEVELNAAEKIILNTGEGEDAGKVVEINAKTDILINSGEKVMVKATESMELKAGGTEYHGLIKIKELHEKLKGLESKFNGHTHSDSWSGTIGEITGSGSVTVPEISAPSNYFQDDCTDYENDKISHYKK